MVELASNRSSFASADRETFGHRVIEVFAPSVGPVLLVAQSFAMIAAVPIAPESVDQYLIASNSWKPLEFADHLFRSPYAEHHFEQHHFDDPFHAIAIAIAIVPLVDIKILDEFIYPSFTLNGVFYIA